MKCHSKLNVTQNGMSLKMENHSKWNVTQNDMSLNWNVTQNGISLKMECHSKWYFPQNGMKSKIRTVMSLKTYLLIFFAQILLTFAPFFGHICFVFAHICTDFAHICTNFAQIFRFCAYLHNFNPFLSTARLAQNCSLKQMSFERVCWRVAFFFQHQNLYLSKEKESAECDRRTPPLAANSTNPLYPQNVDKYF